MEIKKMLRKYGYDIVYYRPFFNFLLAKHAIGTVMDIGANDGQFAKEIHSRLPDAYLYSFEPLKDKFEDLNVYLHTIKKAEAFNFALGDRTEKTSIHRSCFSPSSSFLKMADLHKDLYPKSAGHTEETVDIKRLDDIDLHIYGNLFVKIDVQGFEDKVIKGGINTISRAKLLLVETSFKTLYEGQPLFDDVYDLVRPLGFRYCGHREQHWDKNTNELIYQDSFFEKKA